MDAVERAIAGIGRRQDNVITLGQLVEAGLGARGVAHRVSVRRMQRLHHGVFLLGAVGRNPGYHPGIRLHRPRALARHDVTNMRGIPLSTVARTICDLAATEPRREVEAAFQEALYREIVALEGLADVLAREPRRKGAPVIRALIEDPRMTRSEKERALLRLVDKAQLPRPVTNVRLHGHLVDAYWPAQGLVLEFDGWQAHGHRHAFDRDRKFDQVMLANGLRPMRVTDRHLKHEPVALVARIAQALRG